MNILPKEKPKNRQKLQKKVIDATHKLAHHKGYVSPLETEKPQMEEWRFRKISYLERVLNGNLNQMNFILNVLRKTALDIGLKERTTDYKSWGKGPKQRLYMEKRCSTHFVKVTGGTPKKAPPTPPSDPEAQ